MLTLCSLLLSAVTPALSGAEEYPVNRPISVYAGEPTPNLSCIVGFLSLDTEKTFRTNCNEAHKITIDISIEDRKALKWPATRRKIRFASKADGSAWKGPVTGWVCSTFPMQGTVTYDCVPEVEAPPWFKTPIPGPALGPHMREPGCNGAVCYCNDGDFCNSEHSLAPQPLHLLLLLCLGYL